MINYNIYRSKIEDFSTAVGQIVESVDLSNIVRMVFFVYAADNVDYMSKKAICKDIVQEKFPQIASLTSVIAQRPLVGRVVLEVHSMDDDRWDITIKDRYVVAENESLKCLFASDLVGLINTSTYQQSQAAFESLTNLLLTEGMGYNNIVRQWNYIEKILFCSDGHQHYQDFNDVRSHYYDPVDWVDGYPAATGIGMQQGGVILSFDAVKIKSDYAVKAIDNTLQRAAHVYSKEVLIGETTLKTTPKFERAKALFSRDELLVYISGTAAIRGEESIDPDDIVGQTRVTMENIEQLIAPKTLDEFGVIHPPKASSLKILRVYIKHEADTAKAKAYLDEHYPSVPAFYLWGNVCREELLIEIEGVLS